MRRMRDDQHRGANRRLLHGLEERVDARQRQVLDRIHDADAVPAIRRGRAEEGERPPHRADRDCLRRRPVDVLGGRLEIHRHQVRVRSRGDLTGRAAGRIDAETDARPLRGRRQQVACGAEREGRLADALLPADQPRVVEPAGIGRGGE